MKETSASVRMVLLSWWPFTFSCKDTNKGKHYIFSREDTTKGRRDQVDLFKDPENNWSSFEAIVFQDPKRFMVYRNGNIQAVKEGHSNG